MVLERKKPPSESDDWTNPHDVDDDSDDEWETDDELEPEDEAG